MERKYRLNHIPVVLYGEPSNKVVLYVHDKYGCKENARSFYEVIKDAGWQVLAMDMPEHGERKGVTPEKMNPWTLVPELALFHSYAQERWDTIYLKASGLSAYFCLCAYPRTYFDKVLLVSPIVDMKRSIDDTLVLSGITPEELREKLVVKSCFNETLSMDYYLYANDHPVKQWISPTEILHGDKDPRSNKESVEAFAETFSCGLTVLENQEKINPKGPEVDALETWMKRVIPQD